MATIIKRKNGDGSTSYVAQVRIKGFKPVAKSHASKAEAKAWAEETEEALRAQRKLDQSPRPELSTITVRKLISAYLKDPKTVSRRTYDDLHRLLAWWSDQYGGTRARELSVAVLHQARDLLLPGRQPATVNRYLSAMRSAWNWGRYAGYIPRNLLWPEQHVMLTEPKGRTRFLNDEERAALLEAARAIGPQLYAAIIVSLATGVRQGELLRLNWADVDLEKQTAKIELTKNEDPRAVYLPATAVAALKALSGEKVRAIGPVFIGDDGERLTKDRLNYLWKGARSKAELDDFHWHDLRHSCASYLAQHGATLMQIGHVLGHKSPSMTARYSHLVQGAALPAHAELDKKLRG
jgi:integrase